MTVIPARAHRPLIMGRRGAVATRMMAWLVGGVTAGSLCSVVLSLALQHL